MGTPQKYFIKLHDGSKYEIDLLDFNHIKHRINTGRTKGFYVMRGELSKGMSFAFQYFMSLEVEGKEPPKDKQVRNIDPEKFAPPAVGKVPKKRSGCQHDWNDDKTWEYVQKNVHGKIQYRKQCPSCKKVSSLIKPQQVKNYMAGMNKTLDDVKENKTPIGQLPK